MNFIDKEFVQNFDLQPRPKLGNISSPFQKKTLYIACKSQMKFETL